MSVEIDTHILTKYKVLTKLGSGAYGHVFKVQDKQTGKIYALKKIFNAFQHETDAQRTYRQISILLKIHHKHIITLYEIIKSTNPKDIYLLFEFMNTDLHHAIQENILQPMHLQYISYQLLLSIHYLHNKGIIHRDIKPANILLNEDCTIKLADFGMARFGGIYQSNDVLTDCVATRWYRAPEVLLGSEHYSHKVDMWSVGCILAQMVLKTAIFPGNSTMHQLELIMGFCGKVSESDLKSLHSEVSNSSISYLNSLNHRNKKDIFGSYSKNKKLIDLINRLLVLNPNKRLSVVQALKHEYLEQLYNENDLLMQTRVISLQLDDNKKLQVKDYIKAINELMNGRQNNLSGIANNTSRNKNPQKFSDIGINKYNNFGKVIQDSRKNSNPKNYSKNSCTNCTINNTPKILKQNSQNNNNKKNQLNNNNAQKNNDYKTINRKRSLQKTNRTMSADQTLPQRGKSPKLFGELIRRGEGSRQQSKQKDKQNLNVGNCGVDQFRRVEYGNKPMSFTGLKKTSFVKFRK